jgi:DNA-binding NtrC family response regulator
MAQKNIHVLLVDDDAAHAKIIEEYLRKYPDAHFSVVWKTSIQDALDELDRSQGFNIIVTEYSFPSSNGLDFCVQLNAREIRIPIVFLTAVKDFELAVEAMKIGVEDFFMKDDVSQAALGRTLENVVERVQTRKGMEVVARRIKLAEGRSEAVKELVVTVCHEFNNPLASIKICSDLIKRMLTTDDQQRVLKEFEASFSVVEREIIRLRDMNFERIEPHISPDANPDATDH